MILTIHHLMVDQEVPVSVHMSLSKLRLLLTAVGTIPMRAVKAKAYFIFVPTIAVTAILRWVCKIVNFTPDAKNANICGGVNRNLLVAAVGSVQLGHR
jgi:hypothetical protein